MRFKVVLPFMISVIVALQPAAAFELGFFIGTGEKKQEQVADDDDSKTQVPNVVAKPTFRKKKKEEFIPPPFDIVVWRPFTDVPVNAPVLPRHDFNYQAPRKRPHNMHHSSELHFILSKDKDGYYLYGEGKIDRRAYSRFLQVLIKYQEKGISFDRLMLHSPGGYLNQAIKMGQYLIENQWTVDADHRTKCFSACGMIYSAGINKRLQKGAEIGFHRPYYPNRADTKASVEKAYEITQPYWQMIGGNETLYRTFMGQYGRDDMLILNSQSIAEYMAVEIY